MAKNNSLKKMLNQKTNEIIRYQRDSIEKKNQIEKLKYLLSSKLNNSNNKIPCPSTISTSKRKESNKLINQKNKSSSNRDREFSEYDRDIDYFTDEFCSSNKVSSFKGNSQDLIDISDKDEIDRKKSQNLKTNKSSSCSKNNSNIGNLKNNLTDKSKISSDSNKNKDLKINLLNQKLNEKSKMVNLLNKRIDEMQNIYKSMDEIKLSKEELESKLKLTNKKNE